MTERRRDPYAILGVARGATRAEIGRAYRARAKQTHPDVGGVPPAAMQDLNWAWHLLSDPRRRGEWDGLHPTASSAGHWRAESPVAPRPPEEPHYEGWSGQPSWTASGEPWAGAGAPTVGRSASVGCVGLMLIVVLIGAFVLVAALTPRFPGPFDRETEAQQSAAP
ncbi:MAG TPA: J domain-containing protein [Candidatus Limnocylindria bacterium]|nr:J domain-containing protein [Candidatus Limnocylindria bacterium]